MNTIWRRRAVIWGALLLVAAAFRLWTMQTVGIGGDSVRYYEHAWQVFHPAGPYDLDHWSTRWGIILPLSLLRLVFGPGPLVYMGAALVVSLLTVWAVARAGEELHSLSAGVIAGLVVVFFPEVIPLASDHLPETYVPLYLSLSTLFFLKARNGRAPTANLAWGTAMFCLAYLSKVTAVSFLPALLWLVWTGPGRFRAVLAVVLGFVGFVGVETLVYGIFWKEPLGIVSVILHSHLSDDNDTLTVLPSVWDLLRRYNTTDFRPTWWPLLILATAGAAVLGWRRKLGPSGFLILGVGVFLAGLTFGIKSLHPVVTLEPFQSRYFVAMLPFLSLLVGAGAAEFLESRGWAHWVNGMSVLGVLLAGVVGLSLLLVVPGLPSKWKKRVADLHSHPLVMYHQWKAAVRDHEHHGTPFIGFDAQDEVKGRKAVRAFYRIFVDPIGGKDALVQAVPTVGPGATLMGGDLGALHPDSKVFLVQADPLRVSPTTYGKLVTPEAKKP